MFAYCSNNPINLFDDDGESSLWVLLFLDKYFGFIHMCVARDIEKKYSMNKECWLEGMRCRADIVSNDGSVWEIKTAYTGAKKAKNQASEYINSKTIRGDISIRKLGAAHAFTNSFYIHAGDEYFTVYYATPLKGVILYTVFPGQAEKDENYETYPYEKKNNNATKQPYQPPAFVPIPIIPPLPGGWGGSGAPWENILRPQIA